MTDPDGTITYVNPEFVHVYGYSAAEVIGVHTPRILSSGATSPEEYEGFWQQLLNRQIVRREFVNRTKAGTELQIESSANPILMDDKLVGFLAVQRDITARKATEAALRESERRYRTLAEAAHDSIFIVNRDARIEYANSVSAERFGLHNVNAIGKRLQDVFSPEIAGEMWRELSTAFATGEDHYFETEFDTPKGTLWLGAWLVPMTTDTGITECVMGVARDITDRKRLEREFTQAQKMEAVGRLAGGVAHDFNNLLTAILGYGELLVERLASDPEAVADVREILKAGERASRLTQQLLTFSRKQPFSPQILNLNVIVAELQKMLGRIIGEDIHVEMCLDPSAANIRADRSQLEQLVLNLAVNARDAMPQGGLLRIATANVEVGADSSNAATGAVPGTYVTLSLQDSGCGMSADTLAHVFEPFFTTKPAGKGTGLGLATVYGIVKQSGGFIEFDSKLGVGTVVNVHFPGSADAPAALDGATAAMNAPRGGETILLVEDEPGLRRLMQRTLEGYGYVVLPARDVRDAASLAEHHASPIDLLLSDVIMPGMNGPELAQRVIRFRPAIKVLYVSGFTSHIVLDRGTMSPRSCFLAKPFTPIALAIKVRECLDPTPAARE